MLDLIFSGLEGIGTVIGAIATIIGAYFVSMQIKATRESEERSNVIKRKESTLNAYNAISDNLRKHNIFLRTQFNLEEKNSLTEEDMLRIQNNPELLKHTNYIFDYLSQFAIGVKEGIYDIDTLSNISGRSFIRTYDRYHLYVQYMRSIYTENIYTDTELFIEKLRKKFLDKGESYFNN